MTRHALRGTTVAVIVLASLFAGPAAHASSEPRFNPPFSYLLGAFPLADPLIMALNEARPARHANERRGMRTSLRPSTRRAIPPPRRRGHAR